MDLFEEIVRMRKAGLRGALATIVHTNGSIPSYESSRMLVREDGSIAGTIGGGCVEADVWAAARWKFLSSRFYRSQWLTFLAVDTFRWRWRSRRPRRDLAWSLLMIANSSQITSDSRWRRSYTPVTRMPSGGFSLMLRRTW